MDVGGKEGLLAVQLSREPEMRLKMLRANDVPLFGKGLEGRGKLWRSRRLG